MHVVVVGAGVMGCASARELSRRGARVTLLERAVPGAEASSAAAGVLGAQIESHDDPVERAMFVKARSGYAAWAAELEAETKIVVGYRVSGVLRVARHACDLDELSRIVQSHAHDGLRAELLDGPGARRIEPALDPQVEGAAYFPDDGQVDPKALLRALVAAIAASEIQVRSGAKVFGLSIEAGKCVGVIVDGEPLRADAVVLAAGSWSKTIPGVPAEVPDVKPARGQMVLLDERPPRLHTIVFGAGGYVVPRGDGHVLCGSTLELVGFRREVTAGGVQAILRTAIDLSPGLAAASLESTWSSFRPYTPAGAPLMGKSPLEGLFLATGHHRNGILLAKLTADTVTDAVLLDRVAR